MKTNLLKFAEAKGKNKRLHVGLIERDGEKRFLVRTRTLVDFKTRKILETDNVYSVETFIVLANLINHFIQDSEIMNKIILNEVNKMNQFKGSTNF